MSDSPTVPPLDRPMRPGVERVDREHIRNHPRFQTAKPHRCNAHLEDAIDGLMGGQLTWKEWRQTMGIFFTCVRSEEGKEPPRFGKS